MTSHDAYLRWKNKNPRRYRLYLEKVSRKSVIRYQSDPEYRERKKAAALASYYRNREALLAKLKAERATLRETERALKMRMIEAGVGDFRGRYEEISK